MTDWLDVADVKDFMGDDAPAVDDALQLAVNAVMAYVQRVRPEYDTKTSEGYKAPADVVFGSVMLAARWYSRRSSLLGTTGYSEFGTGTIMRHDPDIARLLKIGNFAPFGFGAPAVPRG